MKMHLIGLAAAAAAATSCSHGGESSLFADADAHVRACGAELDESVLNAGDPAVAQSFLDMSCEELNPVQTEKSTTWGSYSRWYTLRARQTSGGHTIPNGVDRVQVKNNQAFSAQPYVTGACVSNSSVSSVSFTPCQFQVVNPLQSTINYAYRMRHNI